MAERKAIVFDEAVDLEKLETVLYTDKLTRQFAQDKKKSNKKRYGGGYVYWAGNTNKKWHDRAAREGR